MRWTCLLLGLAACSTWTHYEMDEQAWPEVVAALRAADGQAILVAGDRGYLVRPDAMRGELRAFTDALAAAAEAQGAPTSGPGPTIDAPEDRDVTSFPHVDRHLTMGKLGVQGVRLQDGIQYRATLARSENRYAIIVARGTPAVDQAWQRLVAVAQRRAGSVEPGLVVDWDGHGLVRDA